MQIERSVHQRQRPQRRGEHQDVRGPEHVDPEHLEGARDHPRQAGIREVVRPALVREPVALGDVPRDGQVERRVRLDAPPPGEPREVQDHERAQQHSSVPPREVREAFRGRPGPRRGRPRVEAGGLFLLLHAHGFTASRALGRVSSPARESGRRAARLYPFFRILAPALRAGGTV